MYKQTNNHSAYEWKYTHRPNDMCKIERNTHTDWDKHVYSIHFSVLLDQITQTTESTQVNVQCAHTYWWSQKHVLFCCCDCYLVPLLHYLFQQFNRNTMYLPFQSLFVYKSLALFSLTLTFLSLRESVRECLHSKLHSLQTIREML